ncbi:MAG: DNA gyrase inhibitor YacG [Aestuariivita sp.]|nr:DNA gyrase inhibitor YacG [Aestuariivita sp.]MCY4202210.1 DNA gyrase inhibitor YacG [Aestuariivita sp.]MCY4289776.1 DNA gyrase inhibitor YacG [Aestuariivita sp.]MCY4347405.1 DNA gyrase inhibitor YacG [Aestuariivita sp.]
MTCPICRRPTTEVYKPFCSMRCANIDLSRWFDGTYTIALSATEDAEGDGGTDNALPSDGDESDTTNW